MRREEERIYLEAMRYLNLVGLGMHASEMAGNLPFGQQRLLAIARPSPPSLACCCWTSRPPGSTAGKERTWRT